MNRSPDVELVLRDYFAEDGLTAPDHVLDVVEQRISRQPRRRALRLPWRNHPMNRTLTYAAAIAAVLVVAVVGYNLLPRLGIGGPGVSPAPTPAATTVPNASAAPAPTTAAVACDNGTAGCLGKLIGGSFSSANFQPHLTYTVPAGPTDGPPGAFWANSVDLTRTYALVPPGGGYSFSVQSEVAIPEQTADCTTKQKAGVGSTVADWVTFLTEHPGLDAQAPVPFSIDGYSGFSVRFQRAASWTATCPNSVGPAILVIMHPGHEGVRWVDDQQETFWILDVRGQTVLITVDSSPDPDAHTADVANAQPIIDSFQFTVPN